MTIRMTKEDFKLLFEMYNEAFDMVVLKKYYNVEMNKEYDVEKYMRLKDKLLYWAEIQKLDEKDIEFKEEGFINLVKKIAKNDEEIGKILGAQLDEICKIDDFKYQLTKMALDMFKEQQNENNITNNNE